MSGLGDIVGKEVITADAIIIGTVEGVAVDTENWKIPAVRVKVRKGNEGALGLNKRLVGAHKVYVATPQVASVSDTVTLAVKKDQVSEVLVDGKRLPVTASIMLHKKVVGKDGKRIGVIDNVHFDAARGWEVTKLGIKLDKDAKQALELQKGLAPASQITILTKDVKSVGDMVMLRLDLEGLKEYINKKPVSKK
ncbi:MAG TPA: PRC-barrel domain-containing protein [Methanomassiliicoccales archaeon]|jgi:sporulation protein YlmC with PRC-barrel domain|nr:PRC-barrel domain-containing protein [Euryarchaeota archaeon]HOE52912.1 PRC-barrel domain-containing protein [Methanomassiliicoccales archaeon]HPD09192.1 PRC-barrel domain-containing protein [Methanomassiliicoccales archaeon]